MILEFILSVPGNYESNKKRNCPPRCQSNITYHQNWYRKQHPVVEALEGPYLDPIEEKGNERERFLRGVSGILFQTAKTSSTLTHVKSITIYLLIVIDKPWETTISLLAPNKPPLTCRRPKRKNNRFVNGVRRCSTNTPYKSYRPIKKCIAPYSISPKHLNIVDKTHNRTKNLLTYDFYPTYKYPSQFHLQKKSIHQSTSETNKQNTSPRNLPHLSFSSTPIDILYLYKHTSLVTIAQQLDVRWNLTLWAMIDFEFISSFPKQPLPLISFLESSLEHVIIKGNIHQPFTHSSSYNSSSTEKAVNKLHLAKNYIKDVVDWYGSVRFKKQDALKRFAVLRRLVETQRCPCSRLGFVNGIGRDRDEEGMKQGLCHDID